MTAAEPLLIHAQLVRATDLPVPPGQPVPVYVGWRRRGDKWEAWWYGPWPHPFTENISGLPGGGLDSAMPGTYVLPPDLVLIVDDQADVYADSELLGQVARLRLWLRKRPARFDIRGRSGRLDPMKRKRNRATGAQRVAEGNCLTCGAKRNLYKIQCDACQAKSREYLRQWRGTRAWRPGSRGPRPRDEVSAQ